MGEVNGALRRSLLRGAAAGAAGTTALNAVTYLDMVVRGRPPSRTPEQSVEKIAATTHLRIPGEGVERDNRVAGMAPLLGVVVGVATGAVLGAVRELGWRTGPVVATVTATVGAMAGSNAPLTILGVTDPRTWGVMDWISDVLPHLAYGAVTACVLDALDDTT